MSSENGRAAVVAEAVKGAVAEIDGDARAAAGEQIPLFEVPTRLTGDRAAEQLGKVARSRGPGRPPGAENRSTAQFRDYLLRRGVNPLEQLARWAMHTPETLATELECTKLEALRELRAMWGELAPFLFSKVAPTDEAGQAVPQFMMFIGDGGAVQVAGARPPWLAQEPQENQALAEPAGVVSHDGVSHGKAK